MGDLIKFEESFVTADGREATTGRFEFICGCGQKFEAELRDLFGYRCKSPRHCAVCDEKLVAQQKAEKEQAARDAREEKWLAVCPPLYRDTDVNHPELSREAVACVRDWDMKTGIGLVGESGRGKTRLLFLALRRAFDAGKFVRVVSHNRFSKLVMDAFSGEKRTEAAQALDAFRKTGYLMIDDLGKAPSTERADAEMEELVEHRVCNGLPILWSANAGGAWLEARFGPDRGPALVRRLAQFCQCVTV